MILCCNTYVFPIVNLFNISIHYTEEMISKIGTVPKINVYLYDADALDYYDTNGSPGVQVKFTGSSVDVDFGGMATGLVKLS